MTLFEADRQLLLIDAVADLYLADVGHRLRPFLHLTNLANTPYEGINGVPIPGWGITGGVEWVLLSRPN